MNKKETQVSPKILKVCRSIVVGILGEDKTSILFFKKDCKQLGIENLIEFTKGKEVINYCKSHSLNVLFMLKDINDMHWTTFVRTLRTQADVTFIPLVLFLSATADKTIVSQSERKNIELMKSYELKIMPRASLGEKKLAELLIYILSSKRNVDSILNQIDRAKQAFQEGMLEQAKKIYNRILREHDQNVSASYGLTETLKDDPKKYYESLKETLKQDPENYHFKFKLLLHLVKSKQIPAASTVFNEIIVELRRSSDSYWLTHLGEVCAENKITPFLDKIIAVVQSKSSIGSDQWRSYYLKARSSIVKKKMPEAEDFLKQAISVSNGQHPELYNMIGIVQRRIGKMKEAVTSFHEAFDILPQDHRIAYNVALAHLDIGEKESCREFLKKAIELMPTYDKAVIKLKELS